MISKLTRLLSEETLQYAVYAGLTVIVLLFTGVAHARNRSAFPRFIGEIHPLALILGLSLLGLVLFSVLLADGRFAIYRKGNFPGILTAMGLAVPLALVMILIDSRYPFPADMNIAFPESLFFYPAIGFIVEMLFHLLPFCLVYFSLAALFKAWGDPRVIWVSIFFTVVLEPAYQVYFTTGGNTPGVVAYVGVHLFLTNLAQLLLFRRYDFITMYAFRLSYYLLWHILWGHFRLNLLF